MLITLLIVITKARGIRPNDCLATSQNKRKGAAFYLYSELVSEPKEQITRDFQHNIYINLKQQVSHFRLTMFPLSATIFCAEPRHKRIFTAIGAKRIIIFVNGTIVKKLKNKK